MPATDQYSESRWTGIAPGEIERVAVEIAAQSLAQQMFEFAAASDTPPCTKSETLADRGYSPRRRRPRARRLRRTLRPPGVRLRTRKPWRRARRVFEG
jgi:hypothetical protein